MMTETKNQVLLFGATGFVGSSIAAYLSSQGMPFLGIGRSETEIFGRPVFNIQESEKIVDLLSKNPVVINAIGGLKPKHYEEDLVSAVHEFWATFQSVMEVLDLMTPKKVIHISSAGTVYGETDNDKPNFENKRLNPKSWYGRFKMLEENVFSSYCHDNKIDFVCARVSNPFGNTNALEHGFIDVLLSRLSQGNNFTAYFPSGSKRDFIHAPCMAKMLVNLMQDNVTGTFNIGSGESTPLEDILSWAHELFPNRKIIHAAQNEADVARSLISIQKYEERFGEPDCAISIKNYLKTKCRNE
jgi:UDP-glucose 4-epimerase